MFPNVEDTPFDGPFDGRVVYDLVYNPAETRMLREAAAAGCETIGGLDMLVAQAEDQSEWWLGRRPPVRPDAPGGAGNSMKQTSFETFVELAQRSTFVPVVKELVADLLTPVSAFLRIAEHSDYAFLLESVEGGEHVGRYSFLGKDPFVMLRARDGKTIVERAGRDDGTCRSLHRRASPHDGGFQLAIRS